MTTILHVTECFGGGVGRAIQSIVSNSTEHQHHLIWEGDDTPTYSMGFTTLQRLPKSPLRRPRAIAILAGNLNPNIVHIHSSWAGVYSRLLPLKSTVVYQPHCFAFANPNLTPLHKWLYRSVEKLLTRRTDTIVVVSPYEKELANSINPTVRKAYIPNTSSFFHDCLNSQLERIPNLVAMVGRISSQKDPRYFAEVATLVRSSAPNARFVWIGDGDSGLMKELQNANIEVTGWLDQQDLSELLQHLSVYFHSASYEGFPISILDAASVGCPIVARSIPSLRGLPIITGQSPEECAKLIVRSLTDCEFRREQIVASQTLARTMDRDAQRDALRRLYSSGVQ